MAKQPKTSWESSAKWYDAVVGEKGHYYHENVVFPNLLKLMDLNKGKVLDLACGQGVLARKISSKIPYVGIDLSPSLIREAKGRMKEENRKFLVADITKKLPLKERDFTQACIILAMQNLAEPLGAFQNAADHLVEGGKLFLVLNHPAFRIPRLSHWGVDEEKKLQYRRLDAYLSEQKIPIQMRPGKGKKSETTWSFHYPLSTISGWLKEAGFCIVEMQEWISDKNSTGGRAKMENRARAEFPLFLTMVCRKSGAL